MQPGRNTTNLKTISLEHHFIRENNDSKYNGDIKAEELRHKTKTLYRSSLAEVFLGKGVLKISSKLTGELCDFNKVEKQLY